MAIQKWKTKVLGGAVILAAALLVAPKAFGNTGWTLVGWNDLGMHCMDADFSVMAILPPYNNIHAQLMDPNGNLVTNPTGITVTYEAIADASGSINSTSVGKTNFWQYVQALFGVTPPPDQGLAGFSMPGIGNTPQMMTYDTANEWFTAEAVPLTPYDNADVKNYYPMMRLVARDASGTVLATTDIVLPISDEMSCTKCHSSGSPAAAEPSAGWVYNADPQKDYRLNILLLHDEYQQGDSTFQAALSALHLDPLGLYASATSDNHPVLCASCHPSNALPGFGQPGIKPLTEAMHSRHAGVVDPANGMTLGASNNRSACYSCHPGAATRCLRGAMGNAVAADGSLEMQCQSCHGSMAMVGSAQREGWLDEPVCQSCHTGTATNNSGQIRFTSVFDSSGKPRTAADSTFATNPNTPLAGVSLFRFSTGHGSLQCEACHGSTHAILPTSHVNDNVQANEIQGHKGTIVDCESCHATSPYTVSGGPHGMHPVGQVWVNRHSDAAEGSRSACQACHGTDYRGTVLSRSQGDRTISAFGTKNFWRGFQIGCYTCHNGPSSESANQNRAPVTQNLSASTPAGTPVGITLRATDADGDALQLRIVSQPLDGTVGLSGTQATYFPADGFSGTATFTYAAWDGSTDSNLSTVTVSVGAASPCTVSCSATVPTSSDVGTPVTFQGSATTSNCGSAVGYQWNFGDGATSTAQNPSHTYSAAGTYTWTMTASTGTSSCQKSGTITIQSVASCSVSCDATAPSGATVGSTVSFQGSATTSSGCDSALSYSWSFGDGSGSSVQNPSHTYSSAGTYQWAMTASAGESSCQKSGTITIQAVTSCTLSCSAEVATTARVGTSTEFRAHVESQGCSGEPTVVWDFGDGTQASGTDVLHTYSATGTYTWTMTSTLNGARCQSTGTIDVSHGYSKHFRRDH